MSKLTRTNHGSNKRQYSIGATLAVVFMAAIAFSLVSKSRPRVIHNRLLFSNDSDVPMLETPAGHWCPDVLIDGEHLIIEFFNVDVIERDRVPTDGEYFLALVACLPKDISAGESRMLHPFDSPTDTLSESIPRAEQVALEQDKFVAIVFAGGCYYSEGTRSNPCRIRVLERTESRMKIHIDLTVRFPLIGEIKIDDEYVLTQGMNFDIPLSVRAGVIRH